MKRRAGAPWKREETLHAARPLVLRVTLSYRRSFFRWLFFKSIVFIAVKTHVAKTHVAKYTCREVCSNSTCRSCQTANRVMMSDSIGVVICRREVWQSEALYRANAIAFPETVAALELAAFVSRTQYEVVQSQATARLASLRFHHPSLSCVLSPASTSRFLSIFGRVC